MSMGKKRALITGISGQDGSYLAEFLIKKGYKVFGLVRNIDENSLKNIKKIYEGKKLTLIVGDISDKKSIEKTMDLTKPDEIYNLAAQTDYMKSFSNPEETMNTNYRAVGFILDSALKQNVKIHIFQAGSSEMFGKAIPPQNEKTPFKPVSPYGEAKLKAYEEYVVKYREKYKLFICCGILFNHESPRRGNNFVTKIITRSLVKIKLGLLDSFELGHLNAKRDWGFAGDYVEAMWKMLQQKTPQDFVISTGMAHTVRDFVNEVAKCLEMKVNWQGQELEEVLKDENRRVILRIDKKYYRPIDVNYSLGDNSKIQNVLGWKPKHSFEELVKMMVKYDFEEIKNYIKK